MTLLQGDSPIAYTGKDRNLFILDLVISRKVIKAINAKAMATIGQSHPTHLVSKNKGVKVLYQ